MLGERLRGFSMRLNVSKSVVVTGGTGSLGKILVRGFSFQA
jgi:FlaA1/EpsC-like NDP-sugar epimerase